MLFCLLPDPWLKAGAHPSTLIGYVSAFLCFRTLASAGPMTFSVSAAERVAWS